LLRLFAQSNAVFHPVRHFFAKPPLPGSRFQVRGIGVRELLARGVIDRPKGTGDYLLMYFHTPGQAGGTSGTGTATAGDLFIWPPGARQTYGHARRAMLHSWLNCGGSLVTRLLDRNRIPLLTPIALPSPDSFLRFLGDLYRELSLHHPPDEAIAENLLENWLRDLRRTIRPDQTAVPERLRRVREFIDLHCAEKLTVAQLAAMAHWSPTHFTNLFRKHFGTSPVDYAIRQRMHRAAYLLHDTNLSLTDIARRVGFEDIFYFSRLFKKRWGLTARRMRESLHQRPQPGSPAPRKMAGRLRGT
jgi:AraC family transcriptional regulator of arabinose operon